MSEKPSHPIQPLVSDPHGTTRFKENKIVSFLLENGGYDMNQLAALPFDIEDREQFAQLIGYSASGFLELSYVSDETYDRVDNLERLFNDDPEFQLENNDQSINAKVDANELKIAKLETDIKQLRSIVRALAGDLAMYSNLPSYIRNIIQESLKEPEDD